MEDDTIKMSNLPEKTTFKDDDILVIVDSDDNANKKIKISNLLKYTFSENLETITIPAGTTIINGYEINLENRFIVGENSLMLFWNRNSIKKSNNF